MRTALLVEYDGSQYHGWQKQPNLSTVQGALERALSKVANAAIHVEAAGRTDTGVHATHQIIHFDSEVTRNLRSWIHGTNAYLPKDLCVRWAQEMPQDFHARYTALSRTYRYIIYNSAIRPALMRSNITWQYRSLNNALMHEAAQSLIGEHDFTSFRSIECQSKTPMRCIKFLEVKRHKDWVIIDVRANAFLHHMVRNIVGVLVQVGIGNKPLAWVEEVLLAKNRSMGAETASPYGLYLMGVEYPESFKISNQQTEPGLVLL